MEQQQITKDAPGQVKVVCRVRPINQIEINNQGSQICLELLDQKSIKVKLNKQEIEKGEKSIFTFDHVFPMQSTQQEIYELSAQPLVESVLEGFNGTILAYGQTSSGKTFTMQGPEIDDPQLKGIIPRMVTTVFQNIKNSPDHMEFRIKVSMIEIYLEKVRDLMDISKTNLQIREDKTRGIYIQDVTESYIVDESDVHQLMKMGNQNRMISQTMMNEASSRSHLIFTMIISQKNLIDLSAKTGKLFLVDLAGSEKVSKTGAEGKTLDEAKRINQSLSCLGNVINSLTDGKSQHIPYRNSKLTRILQESLGGNSRTTLIITCSPSIYNEAETLSTLRFGIRAKNIKNKPKINRELTVDELQQLLEKAEKEIQGLKVTIKLLEEYIIKNGLKIPESIQMNQLLKDQSLQRSQSQQIQQQGSQKSLSNTASMQAFKTDLDISSQQNPDEDLLTDDFEDFQTQPKKEQQDYQEQIKSLEEEINNQKLSLQTVNENFQQLKIDYSEVQQQLCDLGREHDGCIERQQNVQLFIQQQDDKLREREENYQQERLELEEKLNQKEELIQQLEQKCREKDDQIDNQETVSLKLKKDLEQLQQIKDNLSEKFQELIQDLNQKDTQNNDEQDKIQENLDNDKQNQEIKLENSQLLESLQSSYQLIEQLLQISKDKKNSDIEQLISQHLEKIQKTPLGKKINLQQVDQITNKNQAANQELITQQIVLEKQVQMPSTIDLLQDDINLNQKIQKLELDIEKMKARNDELVKEVKIHKTIIEKLQKQKDSKFQDQAQMFEKLEKEKQKLEEENKIQLSDMEKLLLKNQELTIKIDQLQDQMRTLENQLGTGTKGDLKKNISRLERSIQDVTFKYHELMNQYNYQNVDYKQNEKKLNRKNEEIIKKEKENQQLKLELLNQKNTFEQKIKQLQEEILSVQQNNFLEQRQRMNLHQKSQSFVGENQIYETIMTPSRTNYKIVKPLRGGSKFQQQDVNTTLNNQLNQ